MKKFLAASATALVLAWASSASALLINQPLGDCDPNEAAGDVTCVLSGDDSDQAAIDAALDEFMAGLPSTMLYTQNVGGIEEGAAADLYTTTFDSSDPEDALVKRWDGSLKRLVGPIGALVKDFNQSPNWYLFDISGWDGMEDLSFEGFWPQNGAISQVSLFGDDVGDIFPISEPATLGLFGLGLIGLGLRRRT